MFEPETELDASEIMTTEVLGVDATTTTDTAEEWLDKKGFDVAPVFRDGESVENSGPATRDGSPIGYVEYSELKNIDPDRSVAEISSPVTIDDLIDPQAPFEEMIEGLFDRHWYFIGSRTGIDGVLTRADLNKPPVSAYFYLRIYELETKLTELISELAVDWESILRDEAETPAGYRHATFLDEVETYYQRSVAQDLELKKIQYMTLTHLREIVRHSEELQESLQISADKIHDIKELRNDVAHPHPKNILTVTEDPSPVGQTPSGHRGIEDLDDIHLDLLRTLDQLRD